MPAMPAVLSRVVEPDAWLSIDDPDEVCRTFERLWRAIPGPLPPFAESSAAPRVEAMAWDPWGHFRGGAWSSPVLRGAGGVEVRLGAAAFAAASAAPSPGVPRRARYTEVGGPPAPPPTLWASPLVLECRVGWMAHGRAASEAVRIPAGFVVVRQPPPTAPIRPSFPCGVAPEVASPWSTGGRP